MLKIRLKRTGKKNQPFFRVIVADSRIGPKSGRFLEVLGFYDPMKGEIKFKEDRVKYWITVGAKLSGTVHNFLVDQKIIEGKKLNVLPKKSPTKPRKQKSTAEPEQSPVPSGTGQSSVHGTAAESSAAAEVASATKDEKATEGQEKKEAKEEQKEEKKAEEVKTDDVSSKDLATEEVPTPPARPASLGEAGEADVGKKK